MNSSDERILELERQNAELLRLEARILELETELSRHSGNSSKPPSSDTVTQRAIQKARRAQWSKPAKRRKHRRPGKLSCYLMVRQHLPVKRTAELLTDVLAVDVSTGFLAGIAAEGAQGLSDFLTDVRQRLAATDVLHVDETGARISGVRHWFHVAANPLLTLLDCHEKRGVEATDEHGCAGKLRGSSGS